MKQISQTIRKFTKDTDKGNLKEKETPEKLFKNKYINNEPVIEAKKARSEYETLSEILRKKYDRLEPAKSNTSWETGLNENFKCLKGDGVQPLKVMKIQNSNRILNSNEHKFNKIVKKV